MAASYAREYKQGWSKHDLDQDGDLLLRRLDHENLCKGKAGYKPKPKKVERVVSVGVSDIKLRKTGTTGKSRRY